MLFIVILSLLLASILGASFLFIMAINLDVLPKPLEDEWPYRFYIKDPVGRIAFFGASTVFWVLIVTFAFYG